MSPARKPRAFVGTLQAELRFPGCRTLKDRRGHLRSIMDRLRNMGFSPCQVGEPGMAARAWIAASCSCSTMSAASAMLEGASSVLESPEWELVRSTGDVLVLGPED